MKLITGLGNPGFRYKKTRHNIGFMVIDELKKQIDKQHILLKPTTYMNNSGKPIKSVIEKNKIPIQDLIVIHDDVDIPFGEIKISKDSSSAGHNGVQSIINELKSQDFTRIRMGIGLEKKIKAGKIVLEKFTKQEKTQLKQIINNAVEIIKKELA